MRNIWKLSFKIGFCGKWIIKLFTVALSVFAFAMFALASTSFLYNEQAFMIRAYRNYLKTQPYLVLSDSTTASSVFDADDIALIQEKMDFDFLAGYSCRIYLECFAYDDINGAYPTFDGKIEDERGNLTPEYTEYLEIFRQYEEQKFLINFEVFAEAEEVYNAWEFKLLEGRYPQAENEIAVSEKWFEVFQRCGYCYTFGKTHRELEKNRGTKQEILKYGDLIGKKIAAVNAEFSEVTITGIVDTNSDVLPKLQIYERTPQNVLKAAVFCSEAWKTRELKAGTLTAQYFFASVKGELLKKASLRKIVEVTQELVQKNIQMQKWDGKYYINEQPPVGAMYLSALMRTKDPSNPVFYMDTNLIVLLFMGTGILFLVFSITLNAYLMTASMGRKRKQIGVLRAMGATERKIAQIFLLGTVYLAILIFLGALALSFGVYLRWLRPWLTIPPFDVAILQYNGWTVLFLAVLSVGVPLLSVILPIERYLRSSIVENIKGISSKRK